MKLMKPKVLALIPARGGSKGLPRKNILDVGGKPLIAWTIDAALKSKFIDHVILSSDDEEIMQAAKDYGCAVPFRRPDYLAGDTASSIDVVIHALDQISGFDYVILLQPTSPLRSAADIDEAFTQMLSVNAHSCVSICEADQSPYWMYIIKDGQKIDPVLPRLTCASRRQDLPTVYVLNGAIYIANINWLRINKNFINADTVGYLMSKKSSLDIDTAEDFEIFRASVSVRSQSSL